jgi:chromosome segregation ATPase
MSDKKDWGLTDEDVKKMWDNQESTLTATERELVVGKSIDTLTAFENVLRAQGRNTYNPEELQAFIEGMKFQHANRESPSITSRTPTVEWVTEKYKDFLKEVLNTDTQDPNKTFLVEHFKERAKELHAELTQTSPKVFHITDGVSNTKDQDTWKAEAIAAQEGNLKASARIAELEAKLKDWEEWAENPVVRPSTTVLDQQRERIAELERELAEARGEITELRKSSPSARLALKIGALKDQLKQVRDEAADLKSRLEKK